VAAAHPPRMSGNEPISSGLATPGSGLGIPEGTAPPANEGDGPAEKPVPGLAEPGVAPSDGDGSGVSVGTLVGTGVGIGVGMAVGFGVGMGVGGGGGGGGGLTLTEGGDTVVRAIVFSPAPIPLLAANE
jgi:hypothetical protein